MSLVSTGVPASIDRVSPSFTLEKPADARAQSGGFLSSIRYLDVILILAISVLTLFGLCALFGTVSSGDDYRAAFANRQITWFGISLCGMALALVLDYRWLGKLAGLVYAINIGFLIFVLVAGVTVNSSTSWIRLGPINFQPSETMKVAVVMLMAQWFALRPAGIMRVRDLVVPGLMCGVPCLLVLKQGDLGTAMLFFVIFAAMAFWAGIRRRILIGLVLAAICMACAAYPALKPYQKERLKTFLDPTYDPQGKSYNVIQSLIAVGSGGAVGKGWGEGTQSVHRYLPEAHTDFIFASSVEQTGLLGAGTILSLYAIIFWRILRTVRLARDRFGGLLVIGLGSILLGHVLVNIGMNVALFPITGLPLPFMSYGGTFLLSMFVVSGLILNVSMRRFTANPG